MGWARRSFWIAALLAGALLGCSEPPPLAPLPAALQGARAALLYRRGLAEGFEVYDLTARSLPTELEVDAERPPLIVAFACAPFLLNLRDGDTAFGETLCLPSLGTAFVLAGAERNWAWMPASAEVLPRCGACALPALTEVQHTVRVGADDGNPAVAVQIDDRSVLVATSASTEVMWLLRSGQEPIRVPIEPPLPSFVSGMWLGANGRVELLASAAFVGSLTGADGDRPKLEVELRQQLGLGLTYVSLAVLDPITPELVGVDALGVVLHRDASGWQVLTRSRPPHSPAEISYATPTSALALPEGHPLGRALLVGTASVAELAFLSDNYRLSNFVAFPSLDRHPLSAAASLALYDGELYASVETSDLFHLSEQGQSEPRWRAPAPVHAEPIVGTAGGVLMSFGYGQLQLFLAGAAPPCPLYIYAPNSAALLSPQRSASIALFVQGDRIIAVHRDWSASFARLVDRSEQCDLPDPP